MTPSLSSSLTSMNFTLIEILAILACAQCVYIIVYLLFNAGQLKSAIVPLCFFTVLSSAFALEGARAAWQPLFAPYDHMLWLTWFMTAPLSVLLIFQIADSQKRPRKRYFNLLWLLPIGYFIARSFISKAAICTSLYDCAELEDALIIIGIIVSALSLLMIWVRRDKLNKLSAQKAGKERYWLILSIIALNILITSAFLIGLLGQNTDDMALLRLILGIAFVYLSATSLFRLYPQGVALKQKVQKHPDDLTDIEYEKALKIEKLLKHEQVYQEANYSRANLAAEIGVSESLLSKIVNAYFGQSVPDLLNSHRTEDAKMLLTETKADLATISEEAGFNSITTFNRYFKKSVGITPSQYREKHSKS